MSRVYDFPLMLPKPLDDDIDDTGYLLDEGAIDLTYARYERRLARSRAARALLPPKWEFWNATRMATLRSMWADMVPCKVIAATLGCTVNAVIGKADRMNLSRRAPTERYGKVSRPVTIHMGV